MNEKLNEKLMSVAEFAKHYGTYGGAVSQVLEASGLTPALEVHFGGGMKRFFEIEAAMPVLTAALWEPGTKRVALRPLADAYKLSVERVRAILEAAGVRELRAAPLDVKAGRFVRRYDHKAATEAISRALEDAKREAEAKVAEKAASAPEAQNPAESPVTYPAHGPDQEPTRLDKIEAEMTMLRVELEALRDKVDWLGRQAQLGRQSQSEQVSERPSPLPGPTQLEIAPHNKPLMRLVFAGLEKGNKAAIEREYRACFDMRFFGADEVRGKSFHEAVKNCDALVSMNRFVNHSVVDVAKATGAVRVNIEHGMSDLRHRLTTLYVNGKAA
jgi:hypothetical protein